MTTKEVRNRPLYFRLRVLDMWGVIIQVENTSRDFNFGKATFELYHTKDLESRMDIVVKGSDIEPYEQRITLDYTKLWASEEVIQLVPYFDEDGRTYEDMCELIFNNMDMLERNDIILSNEWS